jgi:protein-S-isoprenylcysteine O-methyltransferase Ste14
MPVNQHSTNSAPVKLLLHIPVPWVFVLTYLFALIPLFLLPVRIHSEEALIIIKISGVVLFAIGAVFASWSLIIFNKARTTTTPGESSKKLIISGPYKFSRNPMYVSLILAYLGEAGFLAQVWPVLFLPLTIIYINTTVIPLEELILRDDFKEDYDIYLTRVRRWL